MTLKPVAEIALGLIDLTNLNDDCADEDIEHLCARAQTPFGHTAAVCVWPQFVALANDELKNTEIKVATVVNFPGGNESLETILEASRSAIENGADEIDLVLPYAAFLAGDVETAREVLEAVCATCREATSKPVQLKVILETGCLEHPDAIRAASELALECGADFLKTSTGKVSINATTDAVRIMLDAILQSGRVVGLKPAGGLKTVEDARTYIDIARALCGDDYIRRDTLRFGASGILDDIIHTIEGRVRPGDTEGY